MDAEWTKVSSVECLGEIDDYVYDISIDEGDPFFFGNDILLHNTDSTYFTVWPVIKDDVLAGKMEWSKETCVQLYDSIAEEVNKAFPPYMYEAFKVPLDKGTVIRGGRELVATKGLFIKKKRYALMYYDKEGTRTDLDGKPGKVKAMGLDLKRADTPKVVQEFLMTVLEKVLTDHSREEIVSSIMEFKQEFLKKHPWEKGTPKRVNNLTSYGQRAEKGKVTVPGHVRAAMHWNVLREMHGDRMAMPICDGQKAIVCYLKPNPMGWDAVAYPTDELRLPTWFLELPFDEQKMEQTVVNKKLENLLGVLKWDITADIDTSNKFGSLFEFE